MKTKRIAIAYIQNDKDEFLMGKRNDNGKFTCPGGHLNKNEDPALGMVRELKEETGLDAKELELLKVYYENGNMMYLFKIKIDKDQKIDASKDPDKECETWEYVDMINVKDKLHIPLKNNIVINYWINH